MRAGGMERGAAWWFGALLGFAGSLLDFYSGYLILAGSQGATGEMGMITGTTASGQIWGIGIVALGMVLAASSFIMVLPTSAGKMDDYGVLMVVYGLVMLFIGGSMYSGITSMTTGTYVPAFAMFAVGVLMVANGVLMNRPRLRRPMA